ncbi:MAG: membrane dipeptidase [Acidobacteria bacterium]|nr:MAG: membrane dipeptidase [Acidobacteriota bacterium]
MQNAALATLALTLSLQTADDLAHRFLIADANILTSYRLTLDAADVLVRSDIGEFDVPRAREGGLDLVFAGLLIPTRHQEAGDAKEVADRRVDEMLAIIESSDALTLVTSPEQLRGAFAEGKIAIALAIENGAPIGSDLRNLHHFYERGVRMVTLVHSRANQIGDSSYAQHRPWKGLSPFGQGVVAEMNRMGMIIDVSHISDAAFYQVLERSKAPVIASHSSCRAFTPGWERNMDDAMIRSLAEGGGVIHITFGGSFLSTKLQQREQPVWAHVEEPGFSINSVAGRSMARKFRQEKGIRYATIGDVVDHIDHVVDLVGIDHVGIGSGFDGSGDSMPDGLKDVSDYASLIEELLTRGYTVDDVEKILSGNLLRVWTAVERIAKL